MTLSVVFPSTVAHLVDRLQELPDEAVSALTYYLALRLVESGKIQPIQVVLGGAQGMLCVFEAPDGERLAAVKPAISKTDEAMLRRLLHEALDEDEVMM